MSVSRYAGYRRFTFERTPEGVLIATFNRPEAYNAVDRELHGELSRVFADIRQDTETRAVVLTRADPFGGGSAAVTRR